MKKEKNYINQSIAISIGYLLMPILLGMIINLIFDSSLEKYDEIIANGSFILSGVVLWLIYGRGKSSKLNVPNNLSVGSIMLLITIAVGLGFASNLFYEGLNYIAKIFGYGFEISTSFNTNLIGFIYVVIIAPIFEEIIFRKIMINRLKKYSILFALIASSFLFGVIHSYGIGNITTISAGLLLGYVYIKTGKIIYPIIIHCINNLFGFLGSFASNNGLTQLYNIIDIFFYAMIIVGVLGTALYVINLRKNKLKLFGETEKMKNQLEIKPYKRFFTNWIIIAAIVFNIIMIIVQLKKL